MLEKSFKETLFLEAKKINIELDDKMLNRFELYKDLLLEWNEKINLTAITDEYEIIMKHFIDSLEIVKYIKEGESIVDVGTGAGFPGVVIAIYFDKKVSITLIDALNKRIDFLKEVTNRLCLSNIELVHGRAEEIAKDLKYREKFDICTSRAVAPLNILLELDVPYLKTNGKCLLLKSNNINEEIEKSKNALKELNSSIEKIYNYTYEVDKEIYNRYILSIVKSKNIPSKYPRIYGKIKKSPL